MTMNIVETQAGFLAVWRRVPRRHLVTYSFDPAGNEVVKIFHKVFHLFVPKKSTFFPGEKVDEGAR